MAHATGVLLQTALGPGMDANLGVARGLIAEATRAGAGWQCLPETVHCHGRHDTKLAAAAPDCRVQALTRGAISP